MLSILWADVPLGIGLFSPCFFLVPAVLIARGAGAGFWLMTVVSLLEVPGFFMYERGDTKAWAAQVGGAGTRCRWAGGVCCPLVAVVGGVTRAGFNGPGRRAWDAATLLGVTSRETGTADEAYAAGLAAFRRGDNVRCRQISEELLASAAREGDDRGQALAHLNLARADFRDARYPSGVENAAAADSFAAAAGAEELRVTALHMRAELTRAMGEYVAAVPLYRQLLRSDQERGDEASLAMEHYNLGSVLLQTGDLDEARGHLERSLSLCDSKPGQLEYTILGWAGWCARSGDPGMAGTLLAAVQGHFEALGEVLDPAEAVEMESHVSSARRRDAGAYERGFERGAALSLPEVRALLEHA